MKTRKSLDELMKVLEQIRVTKYPDVPKELVEKIALNQYDNQDNRNMAHVNTIRIISTYLNKKEI